MKKLLLVLFSVSILFGYIADSINQYGIIFYFHDNATIGTFANSDYWVKGPLTIDSIYPAFNGHFNGWEVDPTYYGAQGYDSRAMLHPEMGFDPNQNFDSLLDPHLPYYADPGDSIISIVKTISTDTTNYDDPWPALGDAVVLTIVKNVPQDSGTSVFRPPFVRTVHPYIPIANIHTELLPVLDSVKYLPNLDSVYSWFKKPQIFYKKGYTGELCNPKNNMRSPYAPTQSIYTNNGCLRFFVNHNDDPVKRQRALIAYVQMCIDLYYFILAGQTWREGGGVQPGHLLPTVFGAFILNNDTMKNYLSNTKWWHENEKCYPGYNNKGLYGDTTLPWGRLLYWNRISTQPVGATSDRDPYGYVDGGWDPGKPSNSYQGCCISQPWKGEALAFNLMQQLKTVWSYPAFFDYCQRWVNVGVWTQPDPCAPAPILTGAEWTDRVNHGWGVTWGMNPVDSNTCILDTHSADGIGRFPEKHGTQTDGGWAGSDYVEYLWNAYYDSTRSQYKYSKPALTILDTNNNGKVIDSIGSWKVYHCLDSTSDTNGNWGLFHSMIKLPMTKDTVTMVPSKYYRTWWRTVK